MTRFSIVMPAHDEASVIGRSLSMLLADAEPGEFDVVVVCNGCSDATASVARAAAPGATVIEVEDASKSAALNVGDAAAIAFPRLYVDADINISTADVRALGTLLESGEVLAASPNVQHRWRESRSWAVRSYYRLWMSLPAVTSGIFGTGVIGLSAPARSRFETWPDLLADDYFCDSLFGTGEKTRHPGVHVTLETPGSLCALVARKARVQNGNRQVRADITPSVGPEGPRSLIRIVRGRPALAADVPAFLGVTFAARVLEARDRRTGRSQVWRRDDSRSRDT